MKIQANAKQFTYLHGSAAKLINFIDIDLIVIKTLDLISHQAWVYSHRKRYLKRVPVIQG